MLMNFKRFEPYRLNGLQIVFYNPVKELSLTLTKIHINFYDANLCGENLDSKAKNSKYCLQDILFTSYMDTIVQ